MFERDVFGQNMAWQDVYRSLNQLLEHLHIAMLQRKPGIPGRSNRLLDVHLAQVRFVLDMITSQLEYLGHDEAEAWDAANVLGQLYGPWWAGSRNSKLRKRHLVCYAELLKAYLELLEGTCEAAAGEPEPSASKWEQYSL